MAHVRRGRWFLPDTPDVLGLLRRQVAVTIEGMDAFVAWAGGDPRQQRGCVSWNTVAMSRSASS
jgi:hypothetical protein